MQDKIILGLLLDHEKLTSYDIKKIMELSTSFFYKTSLGSINPALKKLLKDNAVRLKEKIEKNRLKKYYSITKKGKKIFDDWVTKDIEISKIKVEILLKLFYFSKVTPEKKINLINGYLLKIKKHIKKLEQVKDHCLFNDCANKEQKDTLDFGIDYYNFVYKWFKNYINKN